MFNLSGSEVLFILVIGLVVLGPDKLPDMLRRAGRLYGELRRMSQGVQAELKSALDEPTRELRGTTDMARSILSGAMSPSPSDEKEPTFVPYTVAPSQAEETSPPPSASTGDNQMVEPSPTPRRDDDRNPSAGQNKDV